MSEQNLNDNNTSKDENTSVYTQKINEYLEAIKEEVEGDRGMAYEKFGSGINETLEYSLQIAEIIKDSHPKLTAEFLNSLIGY